MATRRIVCNGCGNVTEKTIRGETAFDPRTYVSEINDCYRCRNTSGVGRIAVEGVSAMENVVAAPFRLLKRIF